MAHVVDTHPQKAHIIQELLKGTNLRKLATTLVPPVAFQSLSNYRIRYLRPLIMSPRALPRILGKDVPQSLLSSITPQMIETLERDKATTPLVERYMARIEKHQQTTDKHVLKAKDGKTVASLITADLKGIELHARVAGVLDTRPVDNRQINFTLALPRCDSQVEETTDRDIPSIDVTPEPTE